MKTERFTLKASRLNAAMINPESVIWPLLARKLKEINEIAEANGARLIVGYYPGLVEIYAPWIENGDAYVAWHGRVVSWLERQGRENGFGVFDYTPAIQNAIYGRKITASLTDYHPNEAGVRLMFDVALPYVREALGQANQ